MTNPLNRPATITDVYDGYKSLNAKADRINDTLTALADATINKLDRLITEKDNV